MKEEPKDLWLYENEAFSEGFETVCGVDEASLPQPRQDLRRLRAADVLPEV